MAYSVSASEIAASVLRFPVYNLYSCGNTCFPSESSEIIIEDLTSMEKKILQLISSGKKRKYVADELYMSERTLSNHLQHKN